jgi:hypothetical protein
MLVGFTNDCEFLLSSKTSSSLCNASGIYWLKLFYNFGQSSGGKYSIRAFKILELFNYGTSILLYVSKTFSALSKVEMTSAESLSKTCGF